MVERTHVLMVFPCRRVPLRFRTEWDVEEGQLTFVLGVARSVAQGRARLAFLLDTTAPAAAQTADAGLQAEIHRVQCQALSMGSAEPLLLRGSCWPEWGRRMWTQLHRGPSSVPTGNRREGPAGGSWSCSTQGTSRLLLVRRRRW